MTGLIHIAAHGLLLLALVACGQKQEGAKVVGSQSTAATPGATPAPANGEGEVKAQAERIATAMAEEDYDTVADLTHPKVVEMMGGRARMIEFVKKSMGDMRAEGFVIESFTVGEPQKATKVGERLYTIVPTKMRMKVPTGVMLSESFFVGASDDGGGKWTFIDGSGAEGREKVKIIFPEAVDKLELPAYKQPVMQKEP